MPGYDTAVVKCEPPSDEETFCPQLSHAFFDDKSSSGFSSIHASTPEVVALNDDASSHLLQHLQVSGTLEELAPPAPAGPAATPVCVKQEPEDTPAHTLETLESTHNAKGSMLLERHLAMLGPGDSPDSTDFTSLQAVKDEPTSEGEQLQLSGDEACESSGARAHSGWTQRDMDAALHALRSNNMSLTKASAAFGIPSTTLWQRARRLGIDTPKREGGARSWTDGDLRRALRALRAGAISANKASKAYGIPSSTLYKIARREGIRLAAPFNAAPVSWRRADLARALAAIRAGAASVQRAARQYGIPTGTLYGRCKREGIELSRSNPTPWSEDAMGEALEAVRIGQMSINQAAIHYNLPYSSLYGRFKRCKYQPSQIPQDMSQLPEALLPPDMSYYPPPGPPLDSDPPHTPHFGVESPDFVQEYPPMYYHQGFNSIATS